MASRSRAIDADVVPTTSPQLRLLPAPRVATHKARKKLTECSHCSRGLPVEVDASATATRAPLKSDGMLFDADTQPFLRRFTNLHSGQNSRASSWNHTISSRDENTALQLLAGSTLTL